MPAEYALSQDLEDSLKTLLWVATGITHAQIPIRDTGVILHRDHKNELFCGELYCELPKEVIRKIGEDGSDLDRGITIKDIDAKSLRQLSYRMLAESIRHDVAELKKEIADGTSLYFTDSKQPDFYEGNEQSTLARLFKKQFMAELVLMNGIGPVGMGTNTEKSGTGQQYLAMTYRDTALSSDNFPVSVHKKAEGVPEAMVETWTNGDPYLELAVQRVAMDNVAHVEKKADSTFDSMEIKFFFDKANKSEPRRMNRVLDMAEKRAEALEALAIGQEPPVANYPGLKELPPRNIPDEPTESVSNLTLLLHQPARDR